MSLARVSPRRPWRAPHQTGSHGQVTVAEPHGAVRRLPGRPSMRGQSLTGVCRTGMWL